MISIKNSPLYLDNASTTKIDDRVLSEMMPYFNENFGNPSANNFHSIKPKVAIEKSRQRVSELLNCESSQIIFNSGSTEGINTVLKSLFFESIGSGKNHLIVSSIEHKAVLEVADYLVTIGCEVTRIGVDQNGVVDLEHLYNSITSKTFLISVMLANNETGVIQPLSKVISFAHSKGVPVFTDATQGVGKIKINLKKLDVDYLCLSAHKINGPKGVGALFVKNKETISPLLHGGGQENGLRGGTYNVTGIVGLGKASEIALKEFEDRINYYKLERKKLLEKFINSNGVENFKSTKKLPNIISVTLYKNNEDFLNINRDLFSASTGSACSASIIEDSHVLSLIPGIDPKKVIRFSL